MKTSVIIPAYGQPLLLIRCLTSLSRGVQGVPPDEVIVVDDGSGLDMNDIVTKSQVKYPLIWESFEENLGRSAARNRGVECANNEILIFLDADMMARRGFLRAHLSAHEKENHTAVIGSITWPKGNGFLRYIGSRGVNKLERDDHVPPWYFVTGNASVRKSDIPDKPFDESFPAWGGEDLDLGMRLEKNNITFVYEPDAETYHFFKGTLSDHLHRTQIYGRRSVPVLIERYPELVKVLRLDLLDSVYWRLSVSTPVYSIIYFLTSVINPAYPPFALYDYLTFAAYARGYLKHEEQAGNED